MKKKLWGKKKNKTPDNAATIKKALFFALSENVKVLKRDIKFALSHNVDVYLMNGAQEAKINKYFKINVLKTIVEDIAHPRLHFIEGINTVVNVTKITKGNNRRYSTIGLLTNNSLSKSRYGQQAMAGVKLNSGENNADIVFVTNTNVAGKKGKNVYYVSGESSYMTIVQKKMPIPSPKNYNVFSIRMPKSHELTVIEGHNMPSVYQLEKDIYDEYVRQQYIKEQIALNIERQLNGITERSTSADPIKTIQYYKSRYAKTYITIPEEEVETIVSDEEDEVATDTKTNETETKADVEEPIVVGETVDTKTNTNGSDGSVSTLFDDDTM